MLPDADVYREEHGFPQSSDAYDDAKVRRYLQEIVDFCAEVEGVFTDREAFFAPDHRGWELQTIAERQIERVAEASRRIHSGFKRLHPEIPWRKIYGFRNRVAHNYDTIDPLVVWGTVTEDFPWLKERMQGLLAGEIPTEIPESEY